MNMPDFDETIVDDNDSYHPRPDASDKMRKLAIGLGAALLIAVVGLLVQQNRMSAKQKAFDAELREAKATQLRPATTLRKHRVKPVYAQPSAPTVNIGAPNPPQMIDLSIDMSEDKSSAYMITMEDLSRGRVMVIRRMARDSNGELRLTLNSSAFGLGDYDLQIEGYNWRGETSLIGWVRLGLR